ncbi:HlyD family secretion protein [Psychroflexus salis]|uniref:Biotin attachment protein n=1 Tax=Psychroflexus salis TaxID=1526574 RepID=A0A916ZY19_9FLAO|nr:HlyD family efflux transporter periplasmic adaptor subunit [Psychroflexus salis]GGE18321.1 biotin attachment protein [Psychroflexus salis]
MLHISKNKIQIREDYNKFKSVKFSSDDRRYNSFNKFVIALFIIVFIVLFLPWTQFVRGNGSITTLRPEQRPQSIQSAIPGRIEKWYIQEGDYVSKGDTIVHISEVKDAYFDPDLLARTQSQVKAKNFSFESYRNKVKALDYQIAALKEERDLKLEQAQNKLLQANLKVQSDSINFEAAKLQLSIAERQLNRNEILENEGLKAVTDVESKKVKYQESLAKIISQENKLLESKNEVLNAQIEITSIKAGYKDKIAKAESEQYTAKSDQANTESQLYKLENEFVNYSIRSGLNYIVAPQDGYINRARQQGVGETFKEGAEIVTIMPAEVELAVETFVAPIDLPLVHVGEEVRIIFDGWPFIFFSGWPNLSYGTFGGKIVAVERFISPNGKYRVLIAPDPKEPSWPEPIRAGTGARSFALLNNVPVWYELWRQINGFPPDYYQPDVETTKIKK